ncbi:MAG: hypothetical protein P8Y44_10330 [Acidobacteriota bacterium]
MTKSSPEVARLRWGEVDLDDGRRFKDVKLFPGGARTPCRMSLLTQQEDRKPGTFGLTANPLRNYAVYDEVE